MAVPANAAVLLVAPAAQAAAAKGSAFAGLRSLAKLRPILRGMMMDIGVEISLYPLQEQFGTVIHGFINRLNADGRFRVVSNSMSTQVFGPCDEVLDLVGRELSDTFAGLECQGGKAVFVMKVFGPLAAA